MRRLWNEVIVIGLLPYSTTVTAKADGPVEGGDPNFPAMERTEIFRPVQNGC